MFCCLNYINKWVPVCLAGLPLLVNHWSSFNYARHGTALALLIRVFTSASVSPRVSPTLPRYQNDLTSSSPSSMVGLSQVVLSFRVLVFLFMSCIVKSRSCHFSRPEFLTLIVDTIMSHCGSWRIAPRT